MPALRFVEATFVPTDGLLLCSISAETPSAIVELGQAAGISFDRISVAVAIGGDRR